MMQNDKSLKVHIRPETKADIEKIWQVNASAFNSETEANLVDRLRISGAPLISLVAERNKKIVGHIIFSPVMLSDNRKDIKIAGLAPMAVMPDDQKQGIGTALVNKGLKHCRSKGYQAVVVLGHPHYYPHFGFVPCSRFGIKSEYDVPDEVFMIKELVNGILTGYRGIVKYHPLFNT
ncbi:MAG: N-acetyltransferase [Desulfobacterales bacterium]|jgi:putative acetyltransferase